MFPKKNREVVLKLDVTKKDYDCYGHNYYFSDMNDSKDYFDLLCYYEKHPEEANEMLHLEHRADVLACGYVIEFQHSPINKKEFNERNWFYTTCGYRVIWIFDLREKYNNNQIEYIDDVSRGYTYKYKWNNAYKTFSDFLPQNFKGGYNDEEKWEKGDVLLFFQLYDEVEGEDDDEQSLMEQVVWAIEDDETGDTNFKTFITNYDRPCNKKNFFDAIKRRKL